MALCSLMLLILIIALSVVKFITHIQYVSLALYTHTYSHYTFSATECGLDLLCVILNFKGILNGTSTYIYIYICKVVLVL
jgi:hypothetical protein